MANGREREREREREMQIHYLRGNGDGEGGDGEWRMENGKVANGGSEQRKIERREGLTKELEDVEDIYIQRYAYIGREGKTQETGERKFTT